MIRVASYVFALTFARRANVKRLVAISLSTYDTKLMRNLTVMAICLGMLALPVHAQARNAGDGVTAAPGIHLGLDMPRLQVAQGDGMSLSEAIESVRRGGNVERIINAYTTVSGGRETHYIKVLTKDGKVKTHKVAGRKRG